MPCVLPVYGGPSAYAPGAYAEDEGPPDRWFSFRPRLLASTNRSVGNLVWPKLVYSEISEVFRTTEAESFSNVFAAQLRSFPREGRPFARSFKAADRVVEKSELMCALWPDVAVEDCNLTQSVFLLRKALQEGPREHRYVVTVPGKGYRIVAAVRRQPGLPATGVRPISTSRIKGGDSLGSIVVLPFRGVNLQPDDEYLGLGIADNLTAMLGRVKQFVVRPSSALFQYAEAELEPL